MLEGRRPTSQTNEAAQGWLGAYRMSRRPDFVRVTTRRNHRGTTTSVECLACGVAHSTVFDCAM